MLDNIEEADRFHDRKLIEMEEIPQERQVYESNEEVADSDVGLDSEQGINSNEEFCNGILQQFRECRKLNDEGKLLMSD